MELTYNGKEVLIVDAIDYTLDGKSRYDKTYWGKLVIDKSGNFMIVDKGGTLSSEVFNLYTFIKENLEEKSKKIDIKDLIQLKQTFSVEEIIKLREADII